MKTLNRNLIVVLLTALVGLQVSAKEEFTKKISKSFDVNKDATLTVKNKFGKIHCQNWDNSSISIEVTITLHAISEEKANKYFDQISIDFSGSSSQVTAITSMDNDIFGKNNSDISIDYLINMPKSINVDITNKFGDIILEEVGGSAIIDLGYGTLNAKRLMGPNSTLNIQFSDDCYVGYVKSAVIDIKYSGLTIDESNDINGESKFSELNIGKIDILTLDTGYDDDLIESVRNLDIEADFADVEIRHLTESLSANCDYGTLKVKEVAGNFKLIDIDNSFSETNIGFNPGVSFRLDATVKMGDLSYPSTNAKISVSDLSYTSKKYEGVIGINPDTASKVLVNSSNSDVTLFYR
jgi:hypothetical protein